ncbi:MAG: thioredoxin domain-containing protein [bacterium]
MKISSGHLVVATLVVLGIAGLAATQFKIDLHFKPPETTQVAQKIVEDKMNSFSDTFARHLAEGKKPNRLIHEKSPYLLQHAFNPVAWQPWSEEAFAMAKKDNKPIFLSIGYSTCHWCHVMEHESFENDSIARIMNENFVCIKVDREERPDVDKVYMTVVQALTGHGGWPLSVWLTPDLKPFFGGTYFPPDSRYGRPGFPDLLRQLSSAWQERREEILASGDNIVAEIKKHLDTPAHATSILMAPVLRTAYAQFYQSYDEKLGGFGQAPKFPRPSVFSFLLRYHAHQNERGALDMTLNTLRRMWAGGMYDHLGGGFHRYAVDAYWRVPHFEKMLYDQAQLAWAYVEAYQITHDDFYAQVARAVLDYVLRDMTHAQGGFYSAEDADSALDPHHPEHKVEGAFYMWRKAEIVTILGERDAEIFNYVFGASDSSNTISDPQGEFEDRNVLYAANTPAEAAERFKLSEDEIITILARAKAKLLVVRGQRPRPHLDDKIITAWNGLMISAFARAYQVFEAQEYLAAASQAAAFILAKNYDSNSQTLKRRYRDGEAKFPAHLDDYAFFVLGLLDLYEAGFDIQCLQHAAALTETQVRLFADDKDGGFFDFSGEDSSILLRTKEDYDGAEPAGNSIAAWNLMRLSQMLNRPEWWQRAERTSHVFAQRLKNAPHVMPQMLSAIDFGLARPKQIIIAGMPEATDTKALLRVVHSRFIPGKILLLADGGAGQTYLGRALPELQAMTKLEGKATAYVCENYACQLPTVEAKTMLKLLEDPSGSKNEADE